MSHEQVLRRLYEAFNDDDSDYLRSVVTDDVVVHVLPNELIPAATLRGREELVCTHEKTLSATNLRQQVESISVCGSFATAYVAMTGTDASGTREAPTAQICTASPATSSVRSSDSSSSSRRRLLLTECERRRLAVLIGKDEVQRRSAAGLGEAARDSQPAGTGTAAAGVTRVQGARHRVRGEGDDNPRGQRAYVMSNIPNAEHPFVIN